MLFHDLDPEWIMRDYKTRLKQAENERLALQTISSQPGLPGPLSRLLMAVANALIAAGMHLRDFASSEPCESTPKRARV